MNWINFSQKKIALQSVATRDTHSSLSMQYEIEQNELYRMKIGDKWEEASTAKCNSDKFSGILSNGNPLPSNTVGIRCIEKVNCDDFVILNDCTAKEICEKVGRFRWKNEQLSFCSPLPTIRKWLVALNSLYSTSIANWNVWRLNFAEWKQVGNGKKCKRPRAIRELSLLN